MGLASPLRTVDTTSTDGVGTYTLDDPASPGGGLRTLADAVAMGHVSDGDTVEYNVEDDTTEGASLLFEECIGTVGNSGTSLTRDSCISSSNSDNFVSWTSGGSRSVTVSLAPKNVLRTANNGSDVDDADTFADNIGAARLNAANIYTGGIQSILPASGEGQIRVKHGSGAVTWALRPTTSDKCEWRDITNSKIPLSADPNGGNVAVGTGYTLVDPSTTPYEAFPSGMDLISSTVPTGYTRSDANQSRLIRLAKSGETLGSEAGGDDIFSSWATAGHSLTIAELAGHDHTVFHGTAVVQSGVDVVTGRVLSSTAGDDQTTSTTGSGTAHSHNMTTPYYRIMARIVKS